MKRFLTIALLLSTAFTAHAERFKPVKLPAPIQATIPRKASSWLYGTIAGNPRLVLAFYSVPNKEAKQPATFKIDIWQRSGKAKPRRLHSIILPDNEYFRLNLTEKARHFAVIEASSLWLRSSTQQTRVLLIRCDSMSGFNADTRGINFLLVFPKGLKNKPLVQQFDDFAVWDGGATHDFSKTDESSIIQVTRTTWARDASGEMVYSSTPLRWNGTAFVQAPQTPTAENP
jgi:hypothetical protein